MEINGNLSLCAINSLNEITEENELSCSFMPMLSPLSESETFPLMAEKYCYSQNLGNKPVLLVRNLMKLSSYPCCPSGSTEKLHVNWSCSPFNLHCSTLE